ncbi:tyrosine-type recombinase/integrase [Scatolibacter rhodanostii]|uniref:tyrosine-type recombinase/integrase n=1 Tax=Scatolibacter rhodanostii TaxID=2014781 RepID=UPI000C077257|nr:tyrosine-type recombinase/integrase [Scatolibacter rhodanostii]
MKNYCTLFSEYLEKQKPNSINTRESYLRDVVSYLSYLDCLQFSPIAADKKTVENFMGFLHNKGRSLTTISRNLASIRCFYKSLIFSGDMDYNPAKGIKLEKAEKKLPQVLTGEEIELLLAQPDITEPKGCRDKAMLELLYATGIRASELINLNLSDFNMRSGVLYCKGAKGIRALPVYPAAIVSVSDYIYRMRSLIAGPESGDALFVNLNGGRLTRQGFWKIIKGYAENVGITKEITPHTLRHSFALHLLENGASVKDIQTMMGHADISSTQIYVQLMDVHVKQVYNDCHPKAKLG